MRIFEKTLEGFLIDFLEDLLKNSRKIVEGISEGFELKESWEIKNKKKVM